MVQAVIDEERPEGRLARDGLSRRLVRRGTGVAGRRRKALRRRKGRSIPRSQIDRVIDGSKWFRGWRSDRRDALGPRRRYAQRVEDLRDRGSRP